MERSPCEETSCDLQDAVYDDSGISDITSSSTGGGGGIELEGDYAHPNGHMTLEEVGTHDIVESENNTSERWAHVRYTI